MDNRRIDELAKNIKNMIDDLSKSHTDYPEYGYDYIDGRIVSIRLRSLSKGGSTTTCGNCEYAKLKGFGQAHNQCLCSLTNEAKYLDEKCNITYPL